MDGINRYWHGGVRLCAADRAPDREEHNGANSSDDQIAPEIRHHFQVEFLEQEAADDGADKPDGEIVKDPARTAKDDLGQPARDQADDDPTENTHRFSYQSFSVMPACPGHDGLSYIFNTRPYASSTASFIISDSVGCGKMVCINSSSVVSRFIATT